MLHDAVDFLSYGSRIPLTRNQFASCVGLSNAQQLMHQLLDFGGSLTSSGKSPRSGIDILLITSDFRDARDLPAIDELKAIDISGNRLWIDSDLFHLDEFVSLEQLDFHDTSLTIVSTSQYLLQAGLMLE